MTALDTEVVIAEYLIGALFPVVITVAVRMPGWRRHTVPFSAHLAAVAGVPAIGAFLMTLDYLGAGAGTVAVIALIIWWWKRTRPDRAARALGGKALARLAALVESMRELGAAKPALGGAQ